MSEAYGTNPAVARQEVEARAADFLQRRRFWSWDAQDDTALESWLDESILHRVTFLRLEAGLERVERLAALSAAKPDATKSLRISFLPLMFRIAAVVGVFAVAGTIAAGFLLRPHDRVFATPVGGHETVNFADGSQIELNTATAIRARMTTQERIVWLDRGEAFFHIKHDPLHPFVVMAGNHRITDLGTEFILRSESSRLQVTVVQGQVSLDTPDSLSRSHAVLLTPGDAAIAEAGKVSVAMVSTRDLNDELSWRRGTLVFDNATLGEAAAEFNRYNRDKIVVADPAAASMTIVGTFRTSDMKLFVQATRDALGLRVENRGSNIVISSLPANRKH
ncbi:MAG TPA: FecR domain-containing protein [Rhizomicrobium sp.]|nr:FecR domain-containing protein [Rhizomicrobium sp.]